ncbi:DUF3080 family protein [Aeromonas bivalvium]|uniref:DUF3080 family protein n=1 Tax=Aeromonas bivalvium TaxID=440079 RepID=UPI0038D018F3
MADRGAALAMVLATTLLAGCEPGPQSQFDTYQTRVASVLERPAPAAVPVTPIPFPPQRALQLTIPDLRVGLLDMLTLNRCGLGALVAERNSPLGRSADHFSRLDYEWQLIQRLDACHSEDPQTRLWLADLARQKRAVLRARFWNALVSSQELRRALSPRPAPLAQDASLVETRQALLTLLQWRDGVLAAESPRSSKALPSLPPLTPALESLYRDRGLARLLYSLELATARLNQSAQQIEQASLDDACPATDPNRVARLRGALGHYYGGAIQPWLTGLDRQFRATAPLLERLLTPLTPQPALSPWRQRYGLGLQSQAWLAFRAASLRHAHGWQRILAACAARQPAP